ncbi:MAG: SusD/RagB family nutrient-binding outer membrane lipoprotein [Bacteroidetes bacterium]|nr:SusD/RagB family nutrient-binding outer membrane lipoprotein [Bacteroidota bacterium]
MIRKPINRFTILLLAMAVLGSCKKLDDLNVNPNGVATSEANPNLLMPGIQRSVALSMLNLGYQDIAGTVQHTQKDGWWTGHNQYEWGLVDWSGWYSLLRTNRFLGERADVMGLPFYKGVHLTMKAFMFGTITDLWGDAPYTKALKGDQLGAEFEYPAYDSQETIYRGVLEDLKAAAKIFATGNNTGVVAAYDLYFAGNAASWYAFTNSLILRYSMRISAKLPDVAKANIEAVFSSGVYLKTAGQDVTMNYIGAASGDSWPSATEFDAGSNFRRLKPCTTLLDKMVQYSDPRVPVWFRPVHCRWVDDNTLATTIDPAIRRNGTLLPGVVSYSDSRYLTEIAAGNVFTKKYNPTRLGRTLDTRQYVGVPPAMIEPSEYNLNPTPGQQLENQHVSQLADVYRGKSGGVLRARIISASEVHFILAEAAQRGWATGTAKTQYETAVRLSLETWGVGPGYAAYIARPGVAYNGTLAQLMEQKWIASWTVATEAWFDYRRTGLPNFKVGPSSTEPVMPLRFTYGNNEINFNATEVNKAINKLEVSYGANRGKNNQWAKSWLLQGTGKPW